MATETPRLSLPYILSNQSQKEITHNEGLNALDIWAQSVIEDDVLIVPPASPSEGAIWIVAAGATGLWLGQDAKIAQWLGGAWRFYSPFEGFRGWLKTAGTEIRFDGAAWQSGVITAGEIRIGGVQVIGAQQSAIADPAGGTVIDVESRSIINDILTTLRTHGIIVN